MAKASQEDASRRLSEADQVVPAIPRRAQNEVAPPEGSKRFLEVLALEVRAV